MKSKILRGILLILGATVLPFMTLALFSLYDALPLLAGLVIILFRKKAIVEV